MEVNDLSFDRIVRCLNDVIRKINDPRSASNATKYSLREAILGAFAAFFLQNESFLEYQRQLNSRPVRNIISNLKCLHYKQYKEYKEYNLFLMSHSFSSELN